MVDSKIIASSILRMKSILLWSQMNNDNGKLDCYFQIYLLGSSRQAALYAELKMVQICICILAEVINAQMS